MDNSTFLTKFFAGAVEFGNRHFTVSGLLFRDDKKVFAKIEMLLLLLTVLSVSVLFQIENFSFWPGLALCLIFSQRVFEYLIVYSRNFILSRGRVFTDFPDKKSRGEWIVIMFLLNLLQVILVFALWYRFLSLHIPSAFSQTIGVLDGFYLSVITFFTLGFGDIVPTAPVTKLIVSFQSFLSFYTLLIVMNGLIAHHFVGKDGH